MPRTPPVRNSPTPQDPHHPTKDKKKRAKIVPVARSGPLPIATLNEREETDRDTQNDKADRAATPDRPQINEPTPLPTPKTGKEPQRRGHVADDDPSSGATDAKGVGQGASPTEPNGKEQKTTSSTRSKRTERKPRSIRLWLTKMQAAQLRELAKDLDIEVDYLIDGLATRARHRLAALRDTSGWRELANGLSVTTRRSDDGRRAKHSSIAMSDGELKEATAPIRDPLGVLSDTLILNAYFDAAFAAEIEAVRKTA